MCTHFENGPNDDRLSFVKLEPLSIHRVYGLKSVATPTWVESAQEVSFEATMSFLRQLPDKKRIHQAVHAEEELALIVPAVDPLAHGDQLNAFEI